MATETDRITLVQTDALVKITEMDHIVLRNKDVETSLRFYVEVLGLKPERVEQWLAGEVRFPSARLNDDTIIDFFGSDQEPTGKDGAKNQDHFCMVIEPTDMEELKSRFEALGVGIQAGPGSGWPAKSGSPRPGSMTTRSSISSAATKNPPAKTARRTRTTSAWLSSPLIWKSSSPGSRPWESGFKFAPLPRSAGVPTATGSPSTSTTPTTTLSNCATTRKDCARPASPLWSAPLFTR